MAPGSRLQELTAKYMQNPRRYFVPLANEYRKSNELDRAIALCREHLPAQPGHMSGHIVLGRAYFEKGDIEAAREAFLTSVELDDENLIALRYLADIATSRNELADARQWYTRMLEADPQNEEIERLLRGLGGAAESPTGVADPIAVPVAAPLLVPVTIPDAIPEPVVVAAPNPPQAVDSGLFDPTPPGLRAITTPVEADAVSATPAALPPVPVRTLDTFDLSQLDAPIAESPLASEGIAVDDGVGFIFDDASALGGPDAAANVGELVLPPIEEADFSTGVNTPEVPAAAVEPPAIDPLVTRPALGALASFASWRTAQERDTPTAPPIAPVRVDDIAAPPPTPVVDDAPDVFEEAEQAETAPEFVTETMAALYQQQGFLQQALDVYRELAARSPWDSSLTQKIRELESALRESSVDSKLEADADKALQFGDLDEPSSGGSSTPSILEALYESSPPEQSETDREPSFGRSWTPSIDRDAPVDDDWFAEDSSVAPVVESGFAVEGMFGVSSDAFDHAALTRGALRPDADAHLVAGGAAPTASAAEALALVFGDAPPSPADESAGDMMAALATQMIGRLPKDAPSLPVPDILDLPSSLPADESTGASAAPLLSFDRFFSGSGAPPRQRIDTPAARGSSGPARPVTPSPAPVPSLSPTFGGVPVIPPPLAAPPAMWASFDQFMPPATPASPTPVPPEPIAPAPSLEMPEPATPVVPPALVPPRPVLRRPAVPPRAAGGPAPYPSFSGLPLDEVAPALPAAPSPYARLNPESSRDTPVIEPREPYASFSGASAREPLGPPREPAQQQPPSAPESPPPAVGSQPDASPREDAAPSEFHRWLEGLT